MKGFLKRIWMVGLIIALCMLVLPSTMLAAEQQNDVYVNGVDTAGMARAANEAATVIDSGTCGDNLTWTLDSAGTLTISGTGEMDDYNLAVNSTGHSSNAPWYDKHNVIKKVFISDDITSIGNYAFCDCSGLTGVTIPNNVTSIGAGAFYYCSGLTGVTIPNSVTSIGNYAFYRCSGLTSIKIPDSITIIGNYTFCHCVGLKNITIPNSVTSIRSSAFDGCSGLTSITISNSVTSIGFGAFRDCSGLTGVTIPNSVTSIGDYAFDNCSGLTVVTIPNSVTSIGDCAFEDCSGLTSITIPNSVTSIGDYAFDNCSGLTSVTIPNSVTSIGSGWFDDCSGLTSVTIPNSVTSIDWFAFRDCSGLKSITIPNSVTRIGSDAFRNCSKLTDVYYSGSETQWNNMNIALGNDCLQDATIHYNGIGTDDTPFNGIVNYLTQYNAENKQIFFGNSNLAYNITETAEIVGANSIEQLVEKYVLVETNPDDIFKIVKISAVESKIGVCLAVGKNSLTIDGVSYTTPEDWILDLYVGKQLLYHISDGNLVGAEILLEKTGRLETYDSSTNKLTIAGVDYVVSNLSNISAYDIKSLLQKNVKIKYDQLNHLYAIEYSNENITPVPTVDGFNLDIYRAKYLSNKSKNVSGYEYMEMKTPCSEFVSALQKTGFDEAVIAWKSFDLISSSIDDPTALYDFVAEPQDMYSAILLSLLEDSISYDIIDCQFETYCKDTDKYISTIQNIIKAKYNMDICNNDVFYSLNAEQKELLYDTAKELYEKDFGDSIDLVSDIFDGLTKGIEFVGNIEDYFERINTCLVVANTNEYMKQVLQEVYNESLKSGNIYLQLAAMDCLEVVTLNQDWLFTKLVFDGLNVIGEEAAKYVISDVVWPQIKTGIYASHPAVLVFQTAYKGSKFVSNLLFSTDKTYEAYLNMLVMNDITEIVDNAFDSLRQKFIDNETTLNANVLANAFDLAYMARDIDCQKAWQLVDVLDNTAVNNLWKLLGHNNFANAKEFCRIYQQSYYTVHKDALFGWVQYLYDDYPDSGLYEYYDKIYEETVNKKCTKEFVAKCPIDVYIYDENNNIVAYIENGKVSGNDQIMLALVDDAKIIRFFDDINYRIEYVATDSGEMDITISEFGQNEDKVRTINFYNVNLTDGQSYCFDVDNQILDDKPYELNNLSTNEIITYDFDSLLSSADEYNVSIQQGTLIDNGESFLNKKAKKNESFELYAYVPDGYTFVCWEASNGADIFEDKTASTTSFIMPEENIIIKAVIKANDISLQPVSNITLNKNTIMLNSLDSKETLLAMVSPENATNKSITWSSDNISVATVDENGVVTAVGNGTAEITATTIDGGYKAVCEVKVEINIDDKVAVSSIALNKPAIILKSLGAKETLLATVLPENATNKSVTWSSDNTSIATVDENGVVTSVGNGTAKITATTIDGGYKAVCEVKVSVNSSTGGNSGYHSGVGSAGNKTSNNNITVFNIAGGGIDITPKNPSKGDTVTLNIVPDNDYGLEQIKVTDSSGNEIKLNKVKENKYTFIMPYGKVKLDATFRKIATTKVEESKVIPFIDVKPNDWFYQAVKFAYEKGLMNGETDNLFMPNNNLNRAMLVTILYRMENTPTISEVNKFSDVANGQWYSSAVVWASANGIVNGYEDGTFLPMQNVSREEMAAMLMRYAKYKGYDVSKTADLSSYVDGNKVSVWAVPNMQWASSSGLIKGDESKKLNPQGNAIRAEAAMILIRFVENIAK